MKKIYITGEINEETFEKFCLELDTIEATKTKTVSLELSSHGGVATDALAIVSRMRTSPCKFIVTGYGLVASAATLILAYGDKRRMTKESWAMVHEDSGRVKGTVTEMQNETKQLRCYEDQWNKLLAERTSLGVNFWTEQARKTRYMTAQDCLNVGLIDELI